MPLRNGVLRNGGSRAPPERGSSNSVSSTAIRRFWGKDYTLNIISFSYCDWLSRPLHEHPRMTPKTKDSVSKTIVVELSAMRSGSTLLKALMSAAPDISSLPEIDFQKYQSSNATQEISALCDERIIVLKRPAWFNETRSYPLLPKANNVKCLILARDVHTNVVSLRKMVFRKAEPFIPKFIDRWMARKYWAGVYGRLLERFPDDGEMNFWIRYEDLVQDPIRWTEKLFAFLGSERSEGVDSYPKPKDYDWKWGTDDGGDKIKSLKVVPNKAPQRALEILDRVKNLPDVASVRSKLGYDQEADEKLT